MTAFRDGAVKALGVLGVCALAAAAGGAWFAFAVCCGALLGGGVPAEVGQLPGAPVVVSFAPQLEVLERADAMLTHAGMNSALECLTHGVPMVAVPIAHDQFGVAARIEWSGVGVRLQPEERTAERIREATRTVLGSKYWGAAQRFKRLIRERNGLSQAADIVEQVARTGEPVLRDS